MEKQEEENRNNTQENLILYNIAQTFNYWKNKIRE